MILRIDENQRYAAIRKEAVTADLQNSRFTRFELKLKHMDIEA